MPCTNYRYVHNYYPTVVVCSYRLKIKTLCPGLYGVVRKDDYRTSQENFFDRHPIAPDKVIRGLEQDEKMWLPTSLNTPKNKRTVICFTAQTCLVFLIACTTLKIDTWLLILLPIFKYIFLNGLIRELEFMNSQQNFQFVCHS